MKRKITWIIAFIPLILMAVMYKYLPEQVPRNFDLSGNASYYGHKSTYFIPAFIPLVSSIVYEVIFSFQKRNKLQGKEAENSRINNGTLQNVILILNIFFTFLVGLLILLALKITDGFTSSFPISKILCIAMGIIFVLMGNLMPKTRRNTWLGFRTKWTRYNDVTWSKSHRFIGFAMVISGILIILSAILFSGEILFYIMIGLLSAVMLIGSIKSYIYYLEETEHEHRTTK